MSLPSRPARFSSPRRGRVEAKSIALFAAASAIAACARFGFDRLGPDPDGGIGAAPGVIHSGAGGAAADVDGGSAGGAGIGSGGQAGVSNGGSAGIAGAGGASGDGSDPFGDAGPAAADCFDGVRNGDEVGEDCGGSCEPCAVCSFETPERLGDPNFAGNDLWSPRLISNGLALFFAVTIPGFGEQIAFATRPDRSSSFSRGTPLPPPVNQGTEGTPFISFDRRSLYFYSTRAGGVGDRDLYVATRTSLDADFDDVTALTSLNSGQLDYLPWLSADELSIYFVSGPAGDCDIVRASRASRADDFAAPEPVNELNSASDEGGISLSSDGREAIFASNRPGGIGGRDLYRATRQGASDPFSEPELMNELDTTDNEIDPFFSFDGRELYFASTRDGGDSAIYRAARRCRR